MRWWTLDAQATYIARARLVDESYKCRWIHVALDPNGAYGLWEGFYTLEPFTDVEWFEASDRDGRVEWERPELRDWYYQCRFSFRGSAAVDSGGSPWRPMSVYQAEKLKKEREDRIWQKAVSIALPLIAAIVALMLLRSCFAPSSGGSYDSYDPDDSGYYVPHGPY